MGGRKAGRLVELAATLKIITPMVMLVVVVMIMMICS